MLVTCLEKRIVGRMKKKNRNKKKTEGGSERGLGGGVRNSRNSVNEFYVMNSSLESMVEH